MKHQSDKRRRGSRGPTPPRCRAIQIISWGKVGYMSKVYHRGPVRTRLPFVFKVDTGEYDLYAPTQAAAHAVFSEWAARQVLQAKRAAEKANAEAA